jgi:hypothetical protein
MVYVVDYINVPTHILERAKEETTRIFRESNVELIWLKDGDIRFEDPTVLNSVVTIHILSRQMVDRAKKPDHVMGWAVPGTRVVKVSYHGIAARLAREAWRDMETACVLGHVVAHEIGHLLLVSRRHSDGGIMQPWLDLRRAAIGALFFTASEAQLIRTKLASR